MIAEVNGVATVRKLFDSHLRELAESGIDQATAEAAGVYSEHDAKKLAALVGWKSWPQRYGHGLVFEYRDLDGNLRFCRVKPERPPERNGKPAKYLQPGGEKSRAYFPPGVSSRLAGDGVEVVITEGEKKALSATKHGFSTIGLSGVWNFKPGGRVSVLLPDLERINWHGRKVFIAFDSDSTENASVASAEQVLSATLKSKGAIVKVVRIPASKPGDKQGLDDFIVSSGAPALRKLMDEAGEPEPVDPGTLRGSIADIDPSDVARMFLKSLTVDELPRLRFWLGEFWHWSGYSYHKTPDHDLRAKLVEYMDREFLGVKRGHVSDVLEHLKSQTLLPAHRTAPCWLDLPDAKRPDPSECVATRSGIVHLPAFVDGSSNHLIPATPRYFSTVAADYAFDPKAPMPKHWQAFLGSLWANDPHSIQTLQEWFGYCLTADTRQQKALLVIGPKRSGKGTIARVLSGLIGEGNVAGPTLSSIATNFGIWPLIGKPLAIISDARFSSRLDSAVVVERLLSITGEDRQTIDRKNMQPIECKLPTRFMILTNELPRLRDSSGAFASRFIVLNTPVSHFGAEDHGLTDRLLGELPGIFCWAAAGWARLRAQGRFTVPQSTEGLVSQLADLSSPISAFVRDACVVGADERVKANDLFKAWKDWCEEANQKPGDAPRFGRDLSANVPSVTRIRGREGNERPYLYTGIGLDSDFRS
ncbi:hypothetical protein Mal64_35110 [Pseudobythopirellula maris]|uniref:SF3 helicase domain-containing protein n=1 Tax=Pseudobythopirellula maris TaxID=2527991 RepID=A0A5C5ZH60_9BACT|nr:phage/plasmid primase, P4 family [Pseudobythopirellula maris]TWT86682.1 hypothetical protein Mal64_35110 [Pseudobythopirellula maris]